MCRTLLKPASRARTNISFGLKKLVKRFLLDGASFSADERPEDLVRFTDFGGNRKVIANVEPVASVATSFNVDATASLVIYMLTPVVATTAGRAESKPTATK